MSTVSELHHFMDYLLVRGFANHDDAMFQQGLIIQVALAELGMEEDGNEILDTYMDFYNFTAQDKIAFCDKVIEKSDTLRLQLWPEWKTLYDELFKPVEILTENKE